MTDLIRVRLKGIFKRNVDRGIMYGIHGGFAMGIKRDNMGQRRNGFRCDSLAFGSAD
jgi:hypothetical protein